MMRLSDHPNILRCFASFVTVSATCVSPGCMHDGKLNTLCRMAGGFRIQERQLWLVIQMMDRGSCLHVMTQWKRMGRGEGLKEDWIAYILKETLQGA